MKERAAGNVRNSSLGLMVDLKHSALLAFFLFALFAGVSAGAVGLSFGNFAESGLAGWTEKIFNGKTDYRINRYR